MASRIYTRTGDGGDTGLVGGGRVPKDHPRVTAYGDVDELNAQLGLARSLGTDPRIDALLGRLQSLLFELGADLATPPQDPRPTQGVNSADVRALEGAIDNAEAELTPIKNFVLPGGCVQAAQLHVARTLCRRAERQVVALRRLEPATRPENVVFLNRLADLLFVLARLANHREKVSDVAWEPRKP